MITLIDEVWLEFATLINAIKKLVRENSVSGQLKFEHQRDYQFPSRLILAANQTNIGLSPEDVNDRALFFIVSWTAENKKMTDPRVSRLDPQPQAFLHRIRNHAGQRLPAYQHLDAFFSRRVNKCNREELEDLTYSSRNDADVVVVRDHHEGARDGARISPLTLAFSTATMGGRGLT